MEIYKQSFKEYRRVVYILLLFMLIIQCKGTAEDRQLEEDWKTAKQAKTYWAYAKFIQKHPKAEYIAEAFEQYFTLRDTMEGFGVCGKYNIEITPMEEEKVLYNGELLHIEDLSLLIFSYLKTGIPNVGSHQRKVQIPQSQRWDSISKVHFDIDIPKKVDAKKSLALVLEELEAGIALYKEFLSNKWYGVPYSQLAKEKQIDVDIRNDTRVSFYDFSRRIKKRILPPPPLALEKAKVETGS